MAKFVLPPVWPLAMKDRAIHRAVCDRVDEAQKEYIAKINRQVWLYVNNYLQAALGGVRAHLEQDVDSND